MKPDNEEELMDIAVDNDDLGEQRVPFLFLPLIALPYFILISAMDSVSPQNNADTQNGDSGGGVTCGGDENMEDGNYSFVSLCYNSRDYTAFLFLQMSPDHKQLSVLLSTTLASSKILF